MTVESEITNAGISASDVESVVDVVRTMRIMQDYLNDETIHGVAGIMNPMLKLVNSIASTDLVDVLERGLQDPDLDRALISPPRVGLYGLIKEMGDEDLQKGIGIALELLKALGRASEEVGK
ncbi:uncharacterized protein YjgD (DUF1641 family) [Methanohalophilus levihalophilus]|uniref:DUF1641 domain-containing protein n=1 Tax=Methanohalophilus levihalophilus TaxID=1431282 RepID=UPI001AE3DF88|nr:DUF1641 domain-containing protein [Methanohalophilus levihalophilus]MBP2030306.1 uncharacterized protein YjgD (DUF1641 family) [Methanohalophilus levihalophilus]